MKIFFRRKRRDFEAARRAAEAEVAHTSDFAPELMDAPGYREFPEPGSPERAFDALGTEPSGECDARKRQDDHVPDMRTQEWERLRHRHPQAGLRRDTRPES